MCYIRCTEQTQNSLPLQHWQFRKQRFGSLISAMEDTVCHGFSENRPVLFISLPPPSFRPSCFPIQPCLLASRLPSLQPTLHSQGELCKTPTRMRAFLALKRQPALLCLVQDRVQPPRPFITWPRPTFSPTLRISSSSYTEQLAAPQLPTGNSQPR